MEEEIYGDDILSKAIEYSESTQFEDEIDRFRRKYRSVFIDHSSKQKDGMVEEQSHELYEAFLVYQDLIETLFDDFIHDNKISKIKFFNSFRAVASGQFTPIFGVHHQQWFLDMLTSWTEYDEFVRLMCNNAMKTSRMS